MGAVVEWECLVVGCGQPKGKGKPRRGWVRVDGHHYDGRKGPFWYCSWGCVFEVAVREAHQLGQEEK